KEQGLGWPWPREAYSALVNFCARAGAASLIMDVLYTEPSSYGPEDDARFGQAVKSFGKVSLPLVLGKSTGGSGRWPDWAASSPLSLGPGAPHTFWPQGQSAVFPIADIAAGAALGNAYTASDPDGIYRRVLPFALLDGRPAPNLALAGFLSVMGPAVAEREKEELVLAGRDWTRRIPLDEDGRAVLRFSGPAGSYTHYGAAAVVQSAVLLQQGEAPSIDPALFAGKHVLFGFTAPGLFDLRPSPMGGVYSGVEVQATILDNLLSQSFVRSASLGLSCSLLALLPLALAWCLAGRGGVAMQGVIWLAAFALPPALALFCAYRGIWLPLIPLSAAALTALLGTSLHKHASKERQKRFIEKAFKSYLAPAVVQRIVDSGEDFGLHGEEREITVFFSDIRGFSSFSEKLPPDKLVRLLNRYFTPMTSIIRQHRGTLDKFIGDAIMAFWNAPEEVEEHSAKALRATLAMHDSLDVLNPDLEAEFGLRLAFGAGLHRGRARVGNMGTDELMDYTIIGDTVNLGSRLEGLCSYYGQRIIMSGECKHACGEGAFVFQRLGKERVKGRERPVDIYTAYSSEQAKNLTEELAASEYALHLYEQREFAQAEQEYARLSAAYPRNAKLYGVYLERCKRYLVEAPPEDWDGAFTHSSK
ncbi:MAG: adenylate/guanylate cyclase domain-containing protein, partial [Desulfovibrionaceae bacterium]|nr:adenylate/guanylate cyclase domain-containing protein [Desulfovibrionaceae bacterium]